MDDLFKKKMVVPIKLYLQKSEVGEIWPQPIVFLRLLP